MFRYVQSAGKRDGIIDDDNLLMMRRAQGMAAVEAKMDPSVSAPGMAIKRNDFAIGGIDHREIPQQHHKCGVSDCGTRSCKKSPSMEKQISRIEDGTGYQAASRR